MKRSYSHLFSHPHPSFLFPFLIFTTLTLVLTPFFTANNASATLDAYHETLQAENDAPFVDDCASSDNVTQSCSSVSGDQVTWIGDSYSDGYESKILEKLPGIDFGPDNYYTRYSKHIKYDGNDSTGREGGITLINKAKSENRLRSHIVFALGTNLEGDTYTKEGSAKILQEVVNAAGSDHYLILVTAFTTDGTNYDGLNEAMRELANSNDRVSVADWAAIAKDHADEYYGGGDGTHPNESAGHPAWVDTIIKTINTSCPASSGSVKALQDKVLELAWPTYRGKDTTKKPEYDAIVKKYESGQVKDSDGSTYNYVGGCSGVDCGAWVSILMRESGWDTEYNRGNGPTSHQLQYLQDSPKWQSLNSLGTSIPEDQLQPGDVAVNADHTYVYVGEIAGFETHIASASLCGRAPMAGKETPGDGSYYWFRNTEASTANASTGSSSDGTSTKRYTNSFSASEFLASNNNKIYDGSRDIWTEDEAKKIEELFPLYKKAADEVGIPWQFLAVVHRLESGQSRENPSNGQGLFQDYNGQHTHADLYTPGTKVDDSNFVEQAKIAAEDAKAAGISTDANDGAIKKVFFSYNGQAGVYITQAKNLGFSDEEAKNGEGSPYVMNYADEKRNPEKNPSGWGQIKTDNGGISYPANTSFVGAFVMYAAIAGFGNGSTTSSNLCCENPITTQTNLGDFTKYTDMTDEQLFDLLDVATHENGGSLNAIKTELSIMANLFEKNGGNRPKNASGFVDYIKTGGWFAGKNAAMIGDGKHDNHPQEYIDAANDIYINGNRTLPVEVDEHDWVGDLSSVTNNGQEIDKNDHSQYQRGVTIIKNIYGSTYTFWAFADDETKSGDPFGYTSGNPAEVTTASNNTTTGNTSTDCCGDTSGTASAAGEAIAKTAADMSWPIQNGSDAGKCKTLSGSLTDFIYNDPSCALNPRDTYEQAVAKYNIPHISTGGYENCKDGTYCDCGMFVWTVLVSSLPDEREELLKHNPNDHGDFLSYLQSSNQWTEIENNGKDDSNLQPGDILINSGHRMVYVGKYGGSYGVLAHASAGNRVGEIGQYYTNHSSGPFQIFRRSGNGVSGTNSSSSSCPGTSGTDGEFIHYYQGDPEWSGHSYGGSSIGPAGCGASALAMIVTMLTSERITPPVIAETIDGAGVAATYLNMGGPAAHLIAEKYSLEVQQIDARDEANTSKLLKEGWKILVSGDNSRKPVLLFSSVGHYIMLRGITDDGKWLVGDSAGSAGSSRDGGANSQKEWSPSEIINDGLHTEAYAFRRKS